MRNCTDEPRTNTNREKTQQEVKQTEIGRESRYLFPGKNTGLGKGGVSNEIG